MEQLGRVGLSSSRWERDAFPLSYSRKMEHRVGFEPTLFLLGRKTP